MNKIGIIGGSGLYSLKDVEIKQEVFLDTPFGKPSDKFTLARYKDKDIVFLPRHGSSHSVLPTEVNYRANIYGMKELGAGRIIAVNACGSLRDEMKPMDFVIPLQFVDRTNHARSNTFFGKGIVAHVGLSRPVCEHLAEDLYKAAGQALLASGGQALLTPGGQALLASGGQAGVKVHYGGTYLNMEGPQFSTLAESNLYRNWGMDIIGMTAFTEARLCREAEICYAVLAAITDYDCWHPGHDSVTAQMVVENLVKNVANAGKILEKVISFIDVERNCTCQDALKDAIITPLDRVASRDKERLGVILSKYLK